MDVQERKSFRGGRSFRGGGGDWKGKVSGRGGGFRGGENRGDNRGGGRSFRGGGRSFRGGGHKNDVSDRGGGRSFRGGGRSFRGGGRQDISDRGGGRSFRGGGRSFRGGGGRGRGPRGGRNDRGFRGGGRGFRGGNNSKFQKFGNKSNSEDRPVDDEDDDEVDESENESVVSENSIVDEQRKSKPKEKLGEILKKLPKDSTESEDDEEEEEEEDDDEEEDEDDENEESNSVNDEESNSEMDEEPEESIQVKGSSKNEVSKTKEETNGRGGRIARNVGKRKLDEPSAPSEEKKQKFDLDFDVPLNQQLFYLKNVLFEAQKKFETDEDRDIFVTNVLGQVEKEFIELVLHQQGSYQLQEILPLTTMETIKPFQQALLGDIHNVCSHKIGSYVMSNVLKRTFELFDEDSNEAREGRESSISWIESVVTEIMENLEDYVLTSPSVYVLLSLLAGLSGCPCVLKNEKQTSSPDFTVRKVPTEFSNLFEKIGADVVRLELENCNDLVYSANSSIAVEKLLMFTSKANEELNDELINGLMLKLFDGLDTSSELPGVLVDKSSSHVVEKMLQYSSPSTFDVFLNKHLKPHIERMARHQIANYILQQLIFSCRKAEQVEVVFETLEPNFDELMQGAKTSNRGGIFRSLAEACVKHNVKQSQFCKCLMSSLKCSEEMLFPSVARLSSYKGVPEDEKEAPVCFHGSLILQALFRFNRPQQIIDSMLSMDRLLLVSVINNKFGSRIVDAFVSSKTVGAKSRTKLVNSLKGSFSYVSSNSYGSRCLENIWKVASLADKRVIAEDLSTAKPTSITAIKMFNKFGLNSFKRKPELWEAVQTVRISKEKMFEDILA